MVDQLFVCFPPFIIAGLCERTPIALESLLTFKSSLAFGMEAVACEALVPKLLWVWPSIGVLLWVLVWKEAKTIGSSVAFYHLEILLICWLDKHVSFMYALIVLFLTFTGWWFDACGPSNLNGMFYSAGQHHGKINGIKWHYFKGPSYSLRSTAMMIRPLDF